MILVSAAVIVNDLRQILICQRDAGGSCGYLWEFPGGKLEMGETPVDCLARECLEELGVTVEVGQFLGALTHSSSGLDFQLIFYFARIVGGEIIAKVHRQTKWIYFSDIGHYELCPADKDALGLIEGYFLLDGFKIKH